MDVDQDQKDNQSTVSTPTFSERMMTKIVDKQNVVTNRRFTAKRTLFVQNVPFEIKAEELREFLNKENPMCYNAVERVRLNISSLNRHTGKGRILFKTRKITTDVLEASKSDPTYVDSWFTINRRTLRFSRWNRNRRFNRNNQMPNIMYDEKDDYVGYEDIDDEKHFDFGSATLVFGSISGKNGVSWNCLQQFSSFVFDFGMNCIRARYQLQSNNVDLDLNNINLYSLFSAQNSAKEMEFRIFYKNIINEIQFYRIQNTMIISIYHPIRLYKVFEDMKFQDFDTEMNLCERCERSVDIKYGQSDTIKVIFTNNYDQSLDECIDKLQQYKLLRYCRMSSLISFVKENEIYSTSNPPKWTLILNENIQYLLACLHTKQPSKLSYSSMTKDVQFRLLISSYSNSTSNKLKIISNALEYIFWNDSNTYSFIYEPVKILNYCISQSHMQKITDDHVADGFGYIRHCWITLSGIQLFPPYLESTNRVVRWFPNKTDHFMRITFCEDNGVRFNHEYSISNETRKYIKNIFIDGIVIGNRTYEFLAFGSSQLNEQSIWMYYYDGTSDWTADKIRQRMGNFSHIKSVAKYAARMGQCLSTTRDSIQTDNINQINDITSTFPMDVQNIFATFDFPSHLIEEKPQSNICFSDGIGRISTSFAKKVSVSLGNTKHTTSAYQIRYGGYKGMVAIHPECKYDLELRPSMNKFNSNDKMFEVCRTSFFSPSYLNKQIITLFETLYNINGYTTKILTDIANKCINDLASMKNNRNRAIYQLKTRSKAGSQSGIHILLTLLKNQFPLTHPFVQRAVQTFIRSELKYIENKTRILIEDGASLLGVMDEYGILEHNEVFIQIRRPNQNSCQCISGDVIITKCPALAPGDLRKFQANADNNVYNKLKHLVNVVVFSQKGILSAPMTMAGSDLDGDVYWITWHEQLLSCLISVSNEKPLYFPNPKPKIVSNVTLNDLHDFFVNYIEMDCLGLLALSHLAVSDQEIDRAKNNKCIILSVLNSYAVDYKKSGTPVNIKKIANWYGMKNKTNLLPKIFPKFMKKRNSVYESSWALGQIFKSCKKQNGKLMRFGKFVENKDFNKLLTVSGYKKYEKETKEILSNYSNEILLIKNRWWIKTEMELFLHRPLNNKKLPNLKDFEVKHKIKYEMNKCTKKYRNIFFNPFNINTVDDNKDNDENDQTLFTIEMQRKASSWYLVTMDNLLKDSEMILSFPFVVYDVLCSILQ